MKQGNGSVRQGYEWQEVLDHVCKATCVLTSSPPSFTRVPSFMSLKRYRKDKTLLPVLICIQLTLQLRNGGVVAAHDGWRVYIWWVFTHDILSVVWVPSDPHISLLTSSFPHPSREESYSCCILQGNIVYLCTRDVCGKECDDLRYAVMVSRSSRWFPKFIWYSVQCNHKQTLQLPINTLQQSHALWSSKLTLRRGGFPGTCAQWT